MSLRALLVLSLVFVAACGGSDGNSSPEDAGMTGGSEGTGGDGSGGDASGGSEGTGGKGTGGDATGGSPGTGGDASGGSEGTGGDATGGNEGTGGNDPCAGLDCSLLDDDCNRGVCSTGLGACVAEPLSDGTGCDDGDACTESDQCTSGVCGGSEKDCSAEDGECLKGVCDPTDGSCVAQADREGEVCYPECFNGGTCQSGECTCSDGPCASTTVAAAGCGVLYWCGFAAPGEDPCMDTDGAGTSAYGDGVCDCGCATPDPDCNNCGDPSCAANHCDVAGDARPDCPVDFKTNGVCDCGCQFVDPECSATQVCVGVNVVCGFGGLTHACPAGTACAVADDGDADPTNDVSYCFWTGTTGTDTLIDCVCNAEAACCESTAGAWDDSCVTAYETCGGSCQP